MTKRAETHDSNASPFDLIGPRDTRQAVAASGAYSRAVGRLRWILPAAVAAVLAALILWPMVGARTMKSIITEAIPNLVVENLRLSGIDERNQPYALMAQRALQAGDAKNLIDLEKPEAEITLNGGSWISGKAQQGRFDQKAKKLWLGGDVHVFYDQGYEFSTNEAQVDMDKNLAWGDKPVFIQGSFGTIEGDGFRMLDNGSTVIIKGHARALFQPPAGSDKPNK